jgi:metallophosphoesterase superfamily enzyme
LSLRLLHLSDIHFRVLPWDEDADQRAELETDLRALIATDGAIDAILIGGDIAFSASAEEYALAMRWIDRLLELTGLTRDRVWTVPGNHDVDRSRVDADAEALSFRLKMATCPVEAIGYNLSASLTQDLAAGRRLLAPLDSYNEFALNFSCAVSAESPMWSDDVTLTLDGWRVRLIGITTVLNSAGYKYENGHLVVGSYQAKFERRPDEVGIVLMHHPPSWIRDWSSIVPFLRRSHVWIFGHEHAYASQLDEDSGVVRLSAGAVAPERDEEGAHGPYVPSFNVVTLTREGRDLRVAITPRVWDVDQAVYAMHGEGVAEFLLQVETTDVEAPPPGQTREFVVPAVEGVPLAPSDPAQKEALDQDERASLRQTTVKYLGLPVVRRHAIARRLDVLSAEDATLPAWELYPRILERIRDRDLIDELIEEMTN